jgi:hypothetical protein
MPPTKGAEIPETVLREKDAVKESREDGNGEYRPMVVSAWGRERKGGNCKA